MFLRIRILKSGAVISTFLILLVVSVLSAGEVIFLEAGKYWVNISQTGPDSYVIRLEISAGEPLQIRTVRIPEIVDASELSTKEEVRALAEAQVSIPVSFIGEGIGRIWIAVNNAEDDEKVQFIVFDVFNAVRGSDVNNRVNDALGRWQNMTTSSVMQFGRTPVKCDQSLRDNIRNADLFGERKSLNGVAFIGTAATLEGKITGVDGSTWGLQFVATRVGRIASFIEVGELPPIQRETANRTEEENQAPNNRQQQQSERNSVENQPSSRENSRNSENQNQQSESKQTDTSAVTNQKPEQKQPEIKSGPYEGTGPVASIPGLSVRKDWAGAVGDAGGSGAGHFGETVVTLPDEINTLSRVDTIELVLEIDTLGSAPGMGRISFDASPMLANARSSGVWYADRFEHQGTMLGEFDTRYDEPEYRFDVTDTVEANLSGKYFVSILNLSRTALNIKNIRFEVKGEY